MRIKIFFLLIFTTSVFANSSQNAIPESAPKNLFFCPPPTALKKDPIKMNWTAANGWQSYGVSFVNTIQTFLGAQWAGAQVGQITCVYKGIELHAFPVLLVFHTLTLEPSGGHWTKNLGGYRNCISSATQDCAFQMRLAPDQQDIYEEAEKLKQDPSPSQTQPGF